MDADLIAKFSLNGKGAVIIGAASGIGRSAAMVFARSGARLLLADQNARPCIRYGRRITSS